MIEIYANANKRTVAARISDCKYDAVDRITKRYQWVGDVLASADSQETLEYLFDVLRLDIALMQDSYVRKAKCHEKDRFSMKTGEELAKRRVIAAHNSSMDRAVGRWEKKFLQKR